MKGAEILVVVLFFFGGGCKTTKSVSDCKAHSKDCITTSPTQTVKDTVCVGLKDHIKKYWSYDENTKLFSYEYKNQYGLMAYLQCFNKMDTTGTMALLGRPSEIRDGFMFYFMNTNCFEYSQQECIEYRLDYNTLGEIIHIQPQTVHWIK